MLIGPLDVKRPYYWSSTYYLPLCTRTSQHGGSKEGLKEGGDDFAAEQSAGTGAPESLSEEDVARGVNREDPGDGKRRRKEEAGESSSEA